MGVSIYVSGRRVSSLCFSVFTAQNVLVFAVFPQRKTDWKLKLIHHTLFLSFSLFYIVSPIVTGGNGKSILEVFQIVYDSASWRNTTK